MKNDTDKGRVTSSIAVCQLKASLRTVLEVI